MSVEDTSFIQHGLGSHSDFEQFCGFVSFSDTARNMVTPTDQNNVAVCTPDISRPISLLQIMLSST